MPTIGERNKMESQKQKPTKIRTGRGRNWRARYVTIDVFNNHIHLINLKLNFVLGFMALVLALLGIVFVILTQMIW